MQPKAVGHAILEQRSVFSLAYRLAIRAGQAKGMRQSGSWWRPVLLGSAVGDIALARMLRKSDRAALAPRLVADAIDAAVWSQHPSGNVELAVQPGVPLALESGLRYGAAGFATPLASALLTNAVNIVRKKPLAIAPFRWPLLGSMFGTALAMLETRHRDTVTNHFEQDLEARTLRAWLAGQNEVAMGADSVVDELCRISPLLGNKATETAIGPMVHAWKANLASTTEVGAIYLGNALAQWQRRHNNFQPVLSNDVWFEMDAGVGTFILTSQQAQWLGDSCDRLSLVGGVQVVLETATEGHRPGMQANLRLGSHRIEIPKDPVKDISPLDVGPVGFALAAYWVFDTTTANNAYCAPAALWPISVANLLASVWAQRGVAREGDASHGASLALASALALIQAVASSLTIRQPRGPDGRQRLPFLTGLAVMGMMLPLYWRDLDDGQRVAVVSAVVASIGIGAYLYPERVNPADLLRELLWIGAASASAVKLRRSLDSSGASLTAALEEAAHDAETHAHAEGRSFVIQLVTEANHSLVRQLRNTDSLDPRLRREAQRRLEDVDQRMAVLSS